MAVIDDKRRYIRETKTLAMAQTIEITRLLSDRTIPEIAGQLRRTMPAVSQSYGTVASLISATTYNESRALAKLPSEYSAVPKKPKESDKALQAAIGFGIAQLTKTGDYGTFQTNLAGSVSKLVLDFDRETIEFNIVTDPDGVVYERVPSANACGFCLTMAAVAEVQRSDYFDGYHNFCNCVLNPRFEGQEATSLPFYEDVQKAYSEADQILERERQEVGWYSMKNREAASKYPDLVMNTPNHLRIMRQLGGYR
jgi:hypothetical protein